MDDKILDNILKSRAAPEAPEGLEDRVIARAQVLSQTPSRRKPGSAGQIARIEQPDPACQRDDDKRGNGWFFFIQRRGALMLGSFVILALAAVFAIEPSVIDGFTTASASVDAEYAALEDYLYDYDQWSL